MPTRKQIRQADIERVDNWMHGYVTRLFGGDRSRGFLYWACDLYLQQAASQPTQEELLECITDGRDDLGIDAYFIDEIDRTIYLFQSKYRSTPETLKKDELAGFLGTPTRLTSRQALVHANEGITNMASSFRECLVDNYELQLIYLTTMNATKPIRDAVDIWTNESLSVDIGGSYTSVPHSAVICDLDVLVGFMDSFDSGREVTLELDLEPQGFHEADAGRFKCLVGSLSLLELAKTFAQHKYKIFKHNPRGPLGSNTVNKQIRATLNDPNQRELFQLLNNGLSAVCTSFRRVGPGESGNVIEITDFQIVNGCQTTHTVWDHWARKGELGDAKVTLKLVEAPSASLRHLISAASNRQSQMRDWDFLFDRDEQRRLQREFLNLEPRLFYELRRGEYRYMGSNLPNEQTSIKAIAQATWAFIGNPGEAKDRIRDIPRSVGSQDGAYHDIFFDDVDAEWLRLPWLTYQEILNSWNDYVSGTGNKGDYREFGRFHILWLVGRGLVVRAGKKQYRELSSSHARQLSETISEWFPNLHEVAVESIAEVVEMERAIADDKDEPLQLRQLFRSSKRYSMFASTHDRTLNRLRS